MGVSPRLGYGVGELLVTLIKQFRATTVIDFHLSRRGTGQL